MPNAHEERLAFQLLHATRFHFVREFVFSPHRRWRADFAIWPDDDTRATPLLVEIEGILHGAGGRHQRARGFAEDCEKYAAMLLAGYPLLRVTPGQVKSGAALQWIEGYLCEIGS